jgi:phenylalanine-4-hydroxylase
MKKRIEKVLRVRREWQVNKFTSFIDMHFDLLLSQVFASSFSIRRMEEIRTEVVGGIYEEVKIF